MMPIDVDVAVVGLGPGGAGAAAAAAAAGYRVAAFDRRARAGVPVQCAELVPGLIGQDARDFARAKTQAVQRMVTNIDVGNHRPCDWVTAPFPGHMIDRARFDGERIDAARAAGAACYLGRAVREVRANVIELADGDQLRAAVLIGADGPRSRVGRSIGRVNRELICAQQVTVPLLSASDATDIFLNTRYPGGYGWLFPAGEHAHIGVGVDVALRAALPALITALHDVLAASGRVAKNIVRTTGGYIPAGGALAPAEVCGTRLTLLAGDAAGLTNPVTGAGIHAAVVSGALAGRAATAWLDGDINAPRDYAEELQELFGRTLARARARRRELNAARRQRQPTVADLRRAWIAFPEYWREPHTPITEEAMSA